MSIKKIIVGGQEHQIDYNALENLPECPVKINIIDYVEDTTKDDHRPAKAAAYADGKIDAVEIFRYACPERIDIDSTVDAEGNIVNEPETHLSYFKDGRPIFARDGDFGYPEIDKTGQFNFRPVWNKNYLNGYVITPIVTDINGKAHNDDSKSVDYNPCYNNFKTPYLTGIDNLYRFTKVQKDINLKLVAVKESDLAYNEITYKIIAPVGYDVTKLPSVKVFRCADQVEKYYKYYLHPEKYETLNPDLMKGEELVFSAAEVEEGAELVYVATGISYDDNTGYPANKKAKVHFLVDASNIEEDYSIACSAVKSEAIYDDESGNKVTNYGNLNAGDYGPTNVLTKIYGPVEVVIRVAPPVSITYDENGNADKTYDETKEKWTVNYGFDLENVTKTGLNSDFVFTIKRGFDVTDTTSRTLEEAVASIAEITVDNNVVSALDVLAIDSITKKNDKLRFKGTAVTGDIVIKLAPRVATN